MISAIPTSLVGQLPSSRARHRQLNHADFNRLANAPFFLQDTDYKILGNVRPVLQNSQTVPEIGIWQRSHDPRLNREVTDLLGVLGANGIELLLKLHDRPIDLMRSVKVQMKAASPTGRDYPFLEADVTRQILQFSGNSRAGIVHFRLSSHGTKVASLPDGEFATYQTTIYDGQRRDESKMVRLAMDFRPGNTVSATPKQNIANDIQPNGQFLFLRLGAQGTRDEFTAEEEVALTAERVLEEYAGSEFTNSDLPPTPEQALEQQLQAKLAKLDMLAESARHPLAKKQQEELQRALPKLLQQLAQIDTLRHISPATALKISEKLTDLAATHPAVQRHPQISRIIQATEQLNGLVRSLAPAGMQIEPLRDELQMLRLAELGAAMMEGRLKTAQEILKHFDLPNARLRIEGLLPESLEKVPQLNAIGAKELSDLQKLLESRAPKKSKDTGLEKTTGKTANQNPNDKLSADERSLFMAVLAKRVADAKPGSEDRATLAKLLQNIESGKVSFTELKENPALKNDAEFQRAAAIVPLLRSTQESGQKKNAKPDTCELLEALASGDSSKILQSIKELALKTNEQPEAPAAIIAHHGNKILSALDKIAEQTDLPPELAGQIPILKAELQKNPNDPVLLERAKDLINASPNATELKLQATAVNRNLIADLTGALRTDLAILQQAGTEQQTVQDKAPAQSSGAEIAVRSDFSAGDLRKIAFDSSVPESVRQRAYSLMLLREAEDKRLQDQMLFERNVIDTKVGTASGTQEQQRQQEILERKNLDDALQKAISSLAAPIHPDQTIANSDPTAMTVNNTNTFGKSEEIKFVPNANDNKDILDIVIQQSYTASLSPANPTAIHDLSTSSDINLTQKSINVTQELPLKFDTYRLSDFNDSAKSNAKSAEEITCINGHKGCDGSCANDLFEGVHFSSDLDKKATEQSKPSEEITCINGHKGCDGSCANSLFESEHTFSDLNKAAGQPKPAEEIICANGHKGCDGSCANNLFDEVHAASDFNKESNKPSQASEEMVCINGHKGCDGSCANDLFKTDRTSSELNPKIETQPKSAEEIVCVNGHKGCDGSCASDLFTGNAEAAVQEKQLTAAERLKAKREEALSNKSGESGAEKPLSRADQLRARRNAAQAAAPANTL